MTLIAWVNDPEATAFLRPYIRSPRVRLSREVLVPAIGGNPQRVGTAFDYAFQYGLAARGWGTIGRFLHDEAMPDLVEASTRGLIEYSAAMLVELVNGAQSTLRNIDPDASLSRKSAQACFGLAAVDQLVFHPRSGDLNEADPVELDQLQRLFAIVPWKSFEPRRQIHLSPSLGRGGAAFGGAAADLLLDECLIELKALKVPAVSLAATRQLVGYALLANTFGFDGLPLELRVSDLGVYQARSGELCTFPLDSVVDPAARDVVLEFILGRAHREGTTTTGDDLKRRGSAGKDSLPAGRSSD